MLPELKICVVMVFLSAILLCSSNAIPINTRERDIDALQRIIGRLLSSRDFQDSLQDSRQVRDIEDLNLLGEYHDRLFFVTKVSMKSMVTS